MSKQVLHPSLKVVLEAVRAKRAFNAEAWIEEKCTRLNDYMRRCGLKAAVVSVSGGVDSSATLGLLAAAQKQPNSPIEKIFGIAQPIHSTPNIQNRAYELCEALGVECITVDQSSLHLQLVATVEKAMNIKGGDFANGQLRSYMRTPVNYYVAQLVGQQGYPCIVMGTGNMDEDGYLFYFCKAGDGIADVQLIGDIHKSEVFTISAKLGVPNSILVAPPSADLWEGQTDEDELGFSYDYVELYTALMKMEEGERNSLLALCTDPDALAEYQVKIQMIDTVHRRNKHKLNCPLNL